MKNGKIAFIMFDYPLGVSAMIINSVKCFVKEGSAIDILITPSGLADIEVELDKEAVRIIKITPDIDEEVRKNIQSYNIFDDFICRSLPRLYSFIEKSKTFMCTYDYIIGVEPLGLFAAAALTKKNAKVIYFNMELIQANTVLTCPMYGNYTQLVWLMEQYVLNNFNPITVITSEDRRQTFLSKNQRQKESMVHVLPVATLGEPIVQRNKIFNQLFNIPDDKIIVLYSGNIQPWAKCLEMVQSVKYWDEKYVFIMHTWNKNSLNSGYFKEIKKYIIPNRIYISSIPVSYDKLDELVSSADIGLLFYENLDENFSQIAHSSNKLAQYMKVGLPIITGSNNGMNKITENEGCGISVSDINHTHKALDMIMLNKYYYVNNTIAYYKAKLEFSKYFNEFYKNIIKENKDDRK